MLTLGFVSAILPDLNLEEVLAFAASNGFSCVEIMCWPKGKAERRYAGITHIDVVGFTKDDASSVVPKKGTGCEKCNKTGYKGRVGLYEVMEITDELRELILVGASALELRRKAIEEGMITLRGSGLRKIKDGVTTIEEVLRETVK